MLGVAAISAASMFLLVTFHVFAAQSAFSLDKLDDAARRRAARSTGCCATRSPRCRRPLAVASGAQQLGMVRAPQVTLLHPAAAALPFGSTRGLPVPPPTPYAAIVTPGVSGRGPVAARARWCAARSGGEPTAPPERPRPSVAVRPAEAARRGVRLALQRGRDLVFGALAFRVDAAPGAERQPLPARCRSARPCTPCRCRRSAERSSTATVATSRCRSSCRRSTPIRNRCSTRSSYAAELAPVLARERAAAPCSGSSATASTSSEYLAHRVSDRVVAEVQKLEPRRASASFPSRRAEYPAGALAGSLIGEVGGDGTGTHRARGAVRADPRRAGRAQLVVERDQQGLDIPNTATHEIEARRGTDIVLTLDEPLQWETEQSLIDEVAATNAKGGMAVVVDTTNGDVLAMASIDGASGDRAAAPVDARPRRRDR